MAALDELVQKRVNEFIDSAKMDHNNGLVDRALENLYQAWEIIPDPKGIYDESYSIVKYIVQVCLIHNRANKGLEWVLKIYSCDTERFDSGEREYLHAKIMLLLSKQEEVIDLLKIAHKKSEGRYPLQDEKDLIRMLKNK
ncbi:MAG: hypothetical protein HY064_03695 [Bacteroidetes bacterium]|nr:hypothetical protein [Bacteroidota bacterium]